MHFSSPIILLALVSSISAQRVRLYDKRRLDSHPSLSHRSTGAHQKLRLGRQSSTFAPLSYADGQISGGTAGNAESEASAICGPTKFAGVDLASVSSADLDNLQTFREDAEAAEVDDFNPQIEAASGDAATALQNGKIKNKVLKLTCEVQALQIQAAQGASNAEKIAAEQKKLDNNIALDKKASGQASTAVAGSGSAGAGASADTASTATTTTAAAEATATETAASNVDAAASSSSGSVFAALSYADGQISSGTAGNAHSEADAVCGATKFAGVDLATVSAEDLDNLQTFREAAEAAETDDFNPQIEAASGDAATALQNGKIKNKVLKLTCEVQALQIKAAQGDDNASDIAAEQKKLTNNIGLDKAASGQASTAVA